MFLFKSREREIKMMQLEDTDFTLPLPTMNTLNLYGAILTENNLGLGRKTHTTKAAKKDLYGVGYEGKTSNQAGTNAPRTQKGQDHTGLDMLPGTSAILTTYWEPQPQGLTLGR